MLRCALRVSCCLIVVNALRGRVCVVACCWHRCFDVGCCLLLLMFVALRCFCLVFADCNLLCEDCWLLFVGCCCLVLVMVFVAGDVSLFVACCLFDWRSSLLCR